MQIEYKFWMTNAKGNQEDWSKREFSADEVGKLSSPIIDVF